MLIGEELALVDNSFEKDSDVIIPSVPFADSISNFSIKRPVIFVLHTIHFYFCIILIQ